MRAALAAGAIAAALSYAPLQCGHKSGPDVRIEDGGDALWDLAMDLRARGDENGAKEALRHLVRKYPSNRHATQAKQEIGGDEAIADAGTDAR